MFMLTHQLDWLLFLYVLLAKFLGGLVYHQLFLEPSPRPPVRRRTRSPQRWLSRGSARTCEGYLQYLSLTVAPFALLPVISLPIRLFRDHLAKLGRDRPQDSARHHDHDERQQVVPPVILPVGCQLKCVAQCLCGYGDSFGWRYNSECRFLISFIQKFTLPF